MSDVLTTLRDIHRFVREAGGKSAVAKAAAEAGVVTDGRVLLDLTDDEVRRLAAALWPPKAPEPVPSASGLSPEDEKFNAEIPF